MTDKLLTPEDLCRMFSKCRKTITRYEQQGLLNPIKINARVFFYDPEEVDAMLEKFKMGGLA